MFEALLLGIGAGVISSFLTGPVFFAMIRTSVEKGFLAGFSLAVGVIISDIILIGIVVFGSHFIDYKVSFDKYVGLAGGIFLIAIGIYYLFSSVTLGCESRTIKKINTHGYVLKGFLMSILTPSTLMFWIIVSSIISVKLNNRLNDKLISFFIAMTTQLAIDTTKSYYANKLRNRIKDHTLQKLNKVAGVIIILFGFWLIIKTYINFY
jgi:threonine/homoserine/homoserine lactone efflux protein